MDPSAFTLNGFQCSGLPEQYDKFPLFPLSQQKAEIEMIPQKHIIVT
jgi:hypothetical protein